jgi:hypothetical protein
MGLLVEILVSGLLLITIGYCMKLNRRLEAMRADEAGLRQIVGELRTASERAETSVAGLKIATAEGERQLGDKLKLVEAAVVPLGRQIEAGEQLLTSIAQLVAANRAALDAKAQERAAAPAQPEPREPAKIERLSDAARAARDLAQRSRERKQAEAA